MFSTSNGVYPPSDYWMNYRQIKTDLNGWLRIDYEPTLSNVKIASYLIEKYHSLPIHPIGVFALTDGWLIGYDGNHDNRLLTKPYSSIGYDPTQQFGVINDPERPMVELVKYDHLKASRVARGNLNKGISKILNKYGAKYPELTFDRVFKLYVQFQLQAKCNETQDGNKNHSMSYFADNCAKWLKTAHKDYIEAVKNWRANVPTMTEKARQIANQYQIPSKN